VEKIKKRAAFYIDGFNLYFGLRSGKLRRYYWLDIQKLCQKIIEPQSDQELTKIKYFTARIRKPQDKSDRQNAFLQAIETLNKVQIFYGKYSSRDKYCSNCGNHYYDNEEKMTDVKIALNIFCDALNNDYDIAYLVSGDSDLSPAIRAVRKYFPEKLIVVCFPPHRFSKELKKLCDSKRKIEDYLDGCKLPEEVINKFGYIIRRPASWS